MKTSLSFCRPDHFVIALLSLLLLTSLTVYSQKIYYVTTTGGAVTKDGSSWTNAYDGTQLQTAIEAASTYSLGNGNQEVKVWVAAGLYKPTSTTDRSISFSMRNNVAVYGGFVGNENLLSSRPALNLSSPSSTTLSGDIGVGGNADNSYHVINNSEAQTTSAVLDGFIITGGHADGSGESDIAGGGMLNQNSSPTLRYCLFVENVASIGGGIANLANFATCSPVITNSGFTQNTASYGGGMHNGNINGSCSPVVTQCTFTGNSATNSGAIDNEGGSPKVTNCSFTNNSAAMFGGVSINYTLQAFTNCSFSGNTASSGGVSYHTSGNTTFTNCNFWNNGGNLTFNNTVTVTANYCLFDTEVANYSGTNNLTTSVSPFVSATDLQLIACSPAVNAGDPASTTATSGTTDLAGNPRFYNGGRIDIGAFESQVAPLPPPVVSSAGESSLTVSQNTAVTLTITGCETGSLNWQGSNATSGTGAEIIVPTAAIGTLVYSATCTIGGCSSEPGTATVVITPASGTGSFDGYVYGADCGSFRGWAWDRNKVNTAVSIDILDGGSVIATLSAGDFRQDLLDAGKGDGEHAFRYIIPESLKNNVIHILSARVTGSSFTLKDAPKALICQSSTEPADNKPPVPPTPTVLIVPLMAQVGVPFTAILPVFTDPEDDGLTYALHGLPVELSMDPESRVISGTPTEANNFLLTYSAADQPGATNSVSFVLIVNPASMTITGSFDGYLDKVECGTIRGWAWDRNHPNTPVTVEFYTDDTVWGSTVANIYRPDLLNAGKGSGAHAYRFEVPASLLGTGEHVIYGRVQGSSFVLKDSGKPLICPSPTRLPADRTESLEVVILGNPVSDQVAVEIRGAKGQPVRLQLTDASGRLIHDHQISPAKAVERQTVLVPNQPSGLLFLRVTTGLRSVTQKILKH